MNDLIKAAREWQSFDPETNCVCPTHFNMAGDPLPDDSVCDRERAWRRYVKVRDSGNVNAKKGKKNETQLGI
jgi:hypothetical protein